MMDDEYSDWNKVNDAQLSLRVSEFICDVFFFQAEDGIRDYKVTGVQTCALPIFSRHHRERRALHRAEDLLRLAPHLFLLALDEGHDVRGDVERRDAGISCPGERLVQIGRASCRERV